MGQTVEVFHLVLSQPYPSSHLNALSITAVKQRDQKQHREVRGVTHSLSSREVRAGTQGWNLEAGTKQKPCRRTAYWLAPQGLPRLLSYISRDHLLKGGTT